MNEEKRRKEAVKHYFGKLQQSLAEQALDKFFEERNLTKEHQKLFYAFILVWKKPRTEASVKLFQSGNKLLDKPGIIKTEILAIREEIRKSLPEEERHLSNYKFLSTDYRYLANLWKDLRHAGLIWKSSSRGETYAVPHLYEHIKFDKRKRLLPVMMIPQLATGDDGKSYPGLFLTKPVPTELLIADVEKLLRCSLLTHETVPNSEVKHYFREALWLFSEEEIQAHLESRQTGERK